MVTKTIEFWFDFASTYSYLSAMRVEAVAAKAGVTVNWRPFLLGPTIKAQGLQTSPFKLYKLKGNYMWRDMERRSEKYNLPFQRLKKGGAGSFPQNGLLAARIALIGLDTGWGKEFCRSVFRAQFARGSDISHQPTLLELAAKAGGSSDALGLAQASSNKMRLRDNVDEAFHIGIFGAPTFVVEGELFWGDDRLEDAIEWCTN